MSMTTLKRKTVVMLPTNKKANIGEITINKTMPNNVFIISKRTIDAWTNIENKGNHLIGNHLYFLSDEQIKEGDWFYSNTGGKTLIHECKKIGLFESFVSKQTCLNYPADECKKVIASTDKLAIESYQGHFEGIDCTNYLPQPSHEFIEAYVRDYNAGKPIVDVMVEYEGYECENGHFMSIEGICSYPHCHHHNYPAIKVDKNNYITIRRVKDVFTLQEISDAFKQESIHYSVEFLSKMLNS